MCIKTQYFYVACGCSADEPTNKKSIAKGLCWIQRCSYSLDYSPYRQCKDIEQKPTRTQLRGLCPSCMLVKPRHKAKTKGHQSMFKTKKYQAYKAECQWRRMEKPRYYRLQHDRRQKEKSEERLSLLV